MVAEDGVQAVVLVSIDLRSKHGRLVSARASASVRKGVQGSCNRAASAKSSGGQGLPDRAAEEQATTRGRKLSRYG